MPEAAHLAREYAHRARRRIVDHRKFRIYSRSSYSYLTSRCAKSRPGKYTARLRTAADEIKDPELIFDLFWGEIPSIQKPC
jgi:hypothetical protein